MDLDSFLVSLYVLVDDWGQAGHARAPRRPGRPALLTAPEVITLAILAQWPRFRSERDFWRFACAHLLPEALCSQGQFNRRLRALKSSSCVRCSGPPPRNSAILRPSTARDGHEPSPDHRKGEGVPQGAVLLRAGHLRQEHLQDLRWVYGFKVGLVVDPWGVITVFGPEEAAASSEERPITGKAHVSGDPHEAYLWHTKGLRGCSGSTPSWLEEYL